MSDSTKVARRQLVVDPELQRRIVRDVVGFPLAAFVVNVIVLGILVGRVSAEIELAGAVVPSLIPCAIAMVGLVIIGCLALLSQALRVSNKIAGPQFGMRRFVNRKLDFPRGSDEEAAAGSVQVTIRKGDYLHVAAHDMNRLLARIEELEAERDALPARSDAVVLAENGSEPVAAGSEPAV